MGADLVGTRVGEFDVLRELGRGGMGVVYEAVQTSLNRRVALKVLGPGFGLTPRAVDRFRREAAAAARLHHTNIVPVYATGEDRGVHYYAMELVDGPALDAVVRQLRGQASTPAPGVTPDLAATHAHVPPDPLAAGTASSAAGPALDRFDRVAALTADVADALHHAHGHGVTHRDVKPSNLLLAADGHLSVTDFGLARLLEEPGMTMTGEFVGTPAYMSPEQVSAGRVPVDHRTDVYSLGATLYELLTLRPPFVADGRDRLLAMVVQKEPEPPRRVNPKVPRDLETVCLKCLEKDPDRRYPTAKELADDLRRYVNRFAIAAKRTGPLGRAKKWVRRNPALSAAGLAVLLALGAAAGFALQAYRAEERRLADEGRRDAEQKAEALRAATERATLEAMGGRFDAAHAALEEAERLGASAGEARFLRAVIAHYSGRLDDALREARQAVALAPDSVAAHALLALVCNTGGDWDGYEHQLREAVAREPRTAEDFLFRGSARTTIDPADALADAAEALRRRPSALAFVILTQIRSTRAEDTGSPADALLAIQDARKARELLPDSPVTRADLVVATAVALQTYRRAGREAELAEYLRAADGEADALRGLPHLSRARWTFATARRDPGRLAAVTDEFLALGPARMTTWMYELPVAQWYRRGEYRAATDFLARAPDPDNSNVYPLRVQMMLEQDGNNARALAELRRVNRHVRTGQDGIWDTHYWYFAGAPEAGRARARELRAGGWRPPPGKPEWHRAMLDYLCGDGDEGRVFERARGSNLYTAWTHWAVGQVRLCEKDFPAAARHFRRFHDAGLLFFFGFVWPELWAERLEAPGSDWPRWVRNPTK